MEFDFHVRGLGGESHISRWDAQALRKLSPEDMKAMTEVVTVMGKRSAVAQSLGAPITDIWRLQSTDQRLYLYAVRRPTGTSVLGGIKVGKKKLFIRTDTAALVEAEPLSVLDFYVHESCQRQGVGKQLFEHVLAVEQHSPAAMAYDRPSPKLLAFLKKHYGLKDYVPQSNNYVVYNDYFQTHSAAPMQRGRLPGMGSKPSPRADASSSYSQPHQPSPSHASVPPWLQPPSPTPAAGPGGGQYAGRSPLPLGGISGPAAVPYVGAGPVPQPGSSGRQWQYGATDGGYPGAPAPAPTLPGLEPSYDGRPPQSDPLGVGYAAAAAPSLQRTGSAGSGYGPGFGRSSGPYQAGSGVPMQAGASLPGPGYIGTGLRTRVVVPAPEYGSHPFVAGGTGEHAGPSGVLGGQDQGQLPGRSLQPSQSFGQRWGQSNVHAIGPSSSAGPGAAGGAGGAGPSPSKPGISGRPPSGAPARPPSGSPYAQDAYLRQPGSGSVASPHHSHQAPYPERRGGQDTLDSFREQQMQRYTPAGQYGAGASGGPGQQQLGARPPPWATDDGGSGGGPGSGSSMGPGPRQSSWSPGVGTPTAPGSAALQGRTGSGSWHSPGAASGVATPGGGGQGGAGGTPGPGPSPSARAAALAQRSGAGAAGCLVW